MSGAERERLRFSFSFSVSDHVVDLSQPFRAMHGARQGADKAREVRQQQQADHEVVPNRRNYAKPHNAGEQSCYWFLHWNDCVYVCFCLFVLMYICRPMTLVAVSPRRQEVACLQATLTAARR